MRQPLLPGFWPRHLQHQYWCVKKQINIWPEWLTILSIRCVWLGSVCVCVCGCVTCSLTIVPSAILSLAKRWRGVSPVRPYSCIEGLSTLSCPLLPYTKSAALTESPGNTQHDVLHVHFTPPIFSQSSPGLEIAIFELYDFSRYFQTTPHTFFWLFL